MESSKVGKTIKQIPNTPEDEANRLVAYYRINLSEPVEPITPTDRRNPPMPEVRVGFWHDPQLPLLCGLGMPGKPERVLIIEPGRFIDEKYKDFTVELFGVRGSVPDEEFSTFLEKPEAHWSPARPKYMGKPDGLLPAGYLRCRRIDTKEIIEMHVWRHRVFLNNSPIYLESLWSASVGWVPMVCGIQFGDPRKVAAQIKKLADAIMLGLLTQEELNREARGGARYFKYPYSPGQKVALHLRYKEIVEAYKKACKARDKLQHDYANQTVRRMVKSGFAKLKVPRHVMDQLFDVKCPASEKSARSLALEHAAIDTLRGYVSWRYDKDDLLYLQREGEKLYKTGIQPVSKEG